MKGSLADKLKRRHVTRRGAVGVIFGAVLLSTILSAALDVVIPSINAHRPVIKHWVIDNVKISNKVITAEVYVHKQQECVVVPNSVIGYVIINDKEVQATISFPNDIREVLVNRSISSNLKYFGTWEWKEWKAKGDVTDVTFQVSNLCNPETTIVIKSDGTTEKNITGDNRVTKMESISIVKER